MKTNILVFGLLIYAGFNLNAQEIRFGFQGGMGVTKSYWTNISGGAFLDNPYNPIASFSLNGYMGFRIKGIWGLSIEPGIIQKGGVDLNSPDEKMDNARFELLYIHAPILYDFYVGNKFFVSIGPEPGYLISVKSNFEDFPTDMKDFYDNEFEICGLVGVNYCIAENADIGIRYSRGLIHTIRYVSTGFTNVKEYNQYLHVIARYKFNPKNKG